MRIRHIAVHAASRVAVPPGHPGERRPEPFRARRTDNVRTEVRVELVPRVAHGGVAVADVPRAPRDNDGLRRAVARADDEIVTVEVELLDRRREQGQVLAVVPRGCRQPLDERPALPELLDRRRHGAADVEQRVQRRVRIELGDRVEHFFAAAHARQPIVDEGNSRLRRSLRRVEGGGRRSGQSMTSR